MGSLKDEMRGLREDHKPCEKADDAESPGSSDGISLPEGPQINTSQDSTSPGDYEPELHMNASHAEERDNNPKPRDQGHPGEVCGNAERSDCIGVKDSQQSVAVPLMQQPEAEKTTAATQSAATMSNKFLSDGEIHGEMSKDENLDRGREKEREIETILVPAPSTPAFSDPCSPAPAGQHHMRTQVSLEVAQCRSAATSPMTPPEGGHSFFFPSSFERSAAVGGDTKDAELQVGRQLEFCSVATSPMTPKTPSTTAFPELTSRETFPKEDKERKSEGSGQKESFPVTAEAEVEMSEDFKFATSKETREDLSSNVAEERFASGTAVGLIDSQITQEDSNQQCKQQRMGSMDQDITIMVTHYNNNEDEESSFYAIETEMVKIDEYEELEGSSNDVKKEDEKENVSPENVHAQDTSGTKAPQNQIEEEPVFVGGKENSDASENKDPSEEARHVSVMKPRVPESPAPFGCHNIRTQVSLEVVQCQSVATSPMTPPEGDQAFCFPSSFGKCAATAAETKDAELQVGQQVEFRSVATAPMTPRTPTATVFPEIKKETGMVEKIVEGNEDEKEQAVDKEEVRKEEEKKETAEEEDAKDARNCKEKCEEPVQEVSWDEKGMTWEVYGAVVEVTVLGSAIQKHLEKQVKKRQPSMPPPPPLNPSAMPLSEETSEKDRPGKRGERDGEVSRRRRNPFRQMMENMQQPHCCSKAHTTE